LCGQNVEEACLILQQTMRNNWTDVYALKGKQTQDYKQPTLPYQEEPKKQRFVTPHPHNRNETTDFSYLEDSYPHRNK
jgi:hypothetical protein